jgi:predicted dehydrogenase
MSETQDLSSHETPSQTLSRRQFLAGAGAAAASFAVLRPALVGGAEAKVNLGLIGCGGRGRWIADLFQKHGGYNLVAAFDYFQDRVDLVGEKFQLPAAQRYTGLLGYRRMLEQKLDAVAIESPPYFHPEQAAAAIDAGKHVYLAKPIAVDVPGCRLVEESGKKATAKKLCFLADFQTRAHPAYQEAVKRVHNGDIGRLVNGEATYQCSLMFKTMDAEYQKNAANPEARLRAWAVDRVLSGDVITEQNIHALDVASWILGAAPLRAYGTGGRAREFYGNCWDHFAVIFYYPKDFLLSFCSKQVGAGWDDICCRVYGTEGTIDTHYFGEVSVVCDEPFKGGRMANLYTDGTVNNIAAFYNSITKGDYSNPTVAPSVRSNLTTILGRMAAYQKAEVTWEQMLKANEKFTFDTKGLKA